MKILVLFISNAMYMSGMLGIYTQQTVIGKMKFPTGIN